MGIGGSIFLIAIGAIIAFAVDVQVGWLDLQVVGWVLMVAGAIALVLLLIYSGRRRTTVTTGDPRAVRQDTYESNLPDDRI
jgi:membrane protein implicated in regulation of membrane protease activity